MAPHKINIKDRLSDGEIDLSMSDLQEVPVKDISVYKKAVSLDLSNNHLKTLPVTFVTLTHLTKLDLSKNQLTELPENFGDLIKLKYLDLYQNQLQYLPLSFNKLKALKWLDLKDNPLVPAVAKVAGPCLDAKQCQTCAKEVVNFFTLVQEQITTDLENRQKQRQKQQQVIQTKDMDNKKSKKKEKTKQKKENGVIKDKKPKTTNKNNRKSNQNFKQKEKKSGFFKSIIALIIFFVLLLFVLTSVKFKYTVGIEDFCKQVYKAGSEMLPPNLQVYSTMISGFVKSAHDHVGNATIRTFHFVTNSENYSQVYNTVLYYVESFKEQYKSYVS